MVDEPMGFESFRKSFYYGGHSDMQAKFLAAMTDQEGADALATVLDRLGVAFDTGDLGPVREAVYEAQVAAYAEDDEPTVHSAPFTVLSGDLADRRLALISAGGVFRVDDDPMGPDGPTQQESLTLIKDFLRGAPTLSEIPRDTPDAMLAARHPGYDARTAQRDPGTVFPPPCSGSCPRRARSGSPTRTTASPVPPRRCDCASRWRRSGRSGCAQRASMPACSSLLDLSATGQTPALVVRRGHRSPGCVPR